MAIFPSWRRRVLDRFEPRNGGFAYRENLHARAVMVTAEEREALLCDHDERRSLFRVLLALDPVVAALAGFLVYAVDQNMTLVAIAAHGTFFFFYPIPLAVWVDAGCRALARGRPSVDEGLGKAEIERRRIGRLSWAGIVGNTALASAWLVMTAARARSGAPFSARSSSQALYST